ncbi:hypothetical protein MIND_00979900 [Mycena indigotica]|uniref:Geranylgeranyl pyrophosphate synthetase n=1 Tax=Mycena indigotica TaxID=2126181 RepID=A0A8H6SFL1_9AGAR|nr:uncharacterized protein MIND_00979900 [Mycena indigotica]KAF7297462.1 hypothetical protein MIND_00979900 [Mycena indigotica]
MDSTRGRGSTRGGRYVSRGTRGSAVGRAGGRGAWPPSSPTSNTAYANPTPPTSPSFYPPPRSETPVTLPSDRDIMAGLHASPLKTLRVPNLGSGASNTAVTIKNLKPLGSYNWTTAATPTIVVPGTPRAWMDRRLPIQVAADTGIVFVDQNSHHAPNGQTLVPLIAAVDKAHEINCRNARVAEMPFDWADEQIDFITDRNGLRKLLRWIDMRQAYSTAIPAQTDERRLKDWRIDMQLAPGNRTVLFNRWEKRDQEQMGGFSYGFNFEKATTTAARGVAESSGHHRIISYVSELHSKRLFPTQLRQSFEGLKMVVRFEVDAYIPTPLSSSSASDLDDLVGRLANMNVSKTPPTSLSSQHDYAASLTSTRATASPEPVTLDNGLTVLEGGTHIPHTSLVELTTRTERRAQQMDWPENFPQLFLAQTPNHFVGVHNRGRFASVVKRQLGRGEFAQVEQQVQPSLRILGAVLKEIAALVKAYGERGRLTLVCREGQLRVYERVSMESCLPDEMLERFEE